MDPQSWSADPALLGCLDEESMLLAKQQWQEDCLHLDQLHPSTASRLQELDELQHSVEQELWESADAELRDAFNAACECLVQRLDTAHKDVLIKFLRLLPALVEQVYEAMTPRSAAKASCNELTSTLDRLLSTSLVPAEPSGIVQNIAEDCALIHQSDDAIQATGGSHESSPPVSPRESLRKLALRRARRAQDPRLQSEATLSTCSKRSYASATLPVASCVPEADEANAFVTVGMQTSDELSAAEAGHQPSDEILGLEAKLRGALSENTRAWAEVEALRGVVREQEVQLQYIHVARSVAVEEKAVGCSIRPVMVTKGISCLGMQSLVEDAGAHVHVSSSGGTTVPEEAVSFENINDGLCPSTSSRTSAAPRDAMDLESGTTSKESCSEPKEVSAEPTGQEVGIDCVQCASVGPGRPAPDETDASMRPSGGPLKRVKENADRHLDKPPTPRESRDGVRKSTDSSPPLRPFMAPTASSRLWETTSRTSSPGRRLGKDARPPSQPPSSPSSAPPSRPPSRGASCDKIERVPRTASRSVSASSERRRLSTNGADRSTSASSERRRLATATVPRTPTNKPRSGQPDSLKRDGHSENRRVPFGSGGKEKPRDGQSLLDYKNGEARRASARSTDNEKSKGMQVLLAIKGGARTASRNSIPSGSWGRSARFDSRGSTTSAHMSWL